MTRRNAKRRADCAGFVMLAAVAASFAAFTSYAVKADAARGLTVSESLCTAGIGCTANESATLRAWLRGQPPKGELRQFAAEARRRIGYKPERPAVEARLIGRCNGRLMAALEESAFPAGCDWVEPIRDADASKESR
jgi:hypothetical protein